MTLSARRLRWSAPLVVVAAVALVATIGSNLSGAAAAPKPRPLSPAELLAKAQSARVAAFSGTTTLRAALGLPDLGSLGGGDTITQLLSGSHQARVWFDGPERFRLALLQPLEETDVVRNGNDLWVWRSRSQTATHALHSSDGQSADAERDTDVSEVPVATPETLANRFLAAVNPSTVVSVGSPTRVAGRTAYQLVLAPRSTATTIGTVTLAIDEATGLPLRFAVAARGATHPAVELAYTTISFSRPGASTFNFKPPHGAHVRQATHAGDLLARPERRLHEKRWGAKQRPVEPDEQAAPEAAHPTTVGTAWEQVVILHGSQLSPRLDDVLRSARSVTGPFGRGRTLHTSLLNVLVLNDGRVAFGAVTLPTLEAALTPTG